MSPLYPSHGEMPGRVGVVVPAWFAADTPGELAERLLLTTLADTPDCLRPEDCLVVTDGSPLAAAAARQVRERLAAEWGQPFGLLELAENRGKGGALAVGIARLLTNPALEWIAARDADGDHFLNDLPHLFRIAEQVAADAGTRSVCVIGSRSSVHAPLGWVRGEYELFTNEVLVEGVAWGLAREGRVWDARFLVQRHPDLQSGYKLYSREAARLAVEALETENALHPDLRLLRVGMEVVPFVSLALGGAAFAEVERKAYFDQPVTSYGRLSFPEFYGSKLAWALGRCGVPPASAALLIDGALVRRPMFTDPAGREGLLETRRLVLDRLSEGEWPDEVPPEPRWRKFL